MIKYTVAIIASMIAINSGAQAQTGSDTSEDRTGKLYVSAFVGDRLGRDQDFDGATVAGAPRHIETPTKDGFAGGAALGVVIADRPFGRFRAEAEISASKNDLESLSLNGVGRQLLRGSKSITAGMVNLAYDTPKFFNIVRFTAGAGAGIAAIDYNINYNVVPTTGPQISISTNESGRLAYQLIAGASFDVMEHLEFTTDARYFSVGNHQVERFNLTAGTLDSVLDTDYDDFIITAGLRYHF